MAKTGPKPTAPGPTYTEELYDARTDANLGESAKIFRDAFCVQYIIDFRGDLALIRCGHNNPKTAKQRASQLIREPYVANRINELVRQLKPDDVVSRQQVMAKMWEEANNTSNQCSTRVAATAHCAKMLGMMKPNEDHSQAPVGVMMIPCMSMAEWQQNAAITQALLKQSAETDAATDA